MRSKDAPALTFSFNIGCLATNQNYTLLKRIKLSAFSKKAYLQLQKKALITDVIRAFE
jgi:hypothetical protein